jgi:hypothetical protein
MILECNLCGLYSPCRLKNVNLIKVSVTSVMQIYNSVFRRGAKQYNHNYPKKLAERKEGNLDIETQSINIIPSAS